MKVKSILMLAMLFAALSAGAQSMRVHLKDGSIVNYPASTYDFVDFIPSSNTNPNMGFAPEGVVAIDMGLPSGTLWANMNVGATDATDYGLYFAWGETTGYSSSEEKRKFKWSYYKWMAPNKYSWEWINKYQIKDNKTDGCWYNADFQFIGDGKSELDIDDDAAHANWGGAWFMPTLEDFFELVNNTTITETTFKGVRGYKYTSKTNGNAIFIPYAGYFIEENLNRGGGYYWLKNLKSTDCAYSSWKTSGYIKSRELGLPVRPVLKIQ